MLTKLEKQSCRRLGITPVRKMIKFWPSAKKPGLYLHRYYGGACLAAKSVSGALQARLFMDKKTAFRDAVMFLTE